MSHSLCSRSVSASRNDGPSSRSSRGCRFQALLDLVVLAAGSYTHLDQTSGGVELLVRPACACSQVPDARARPFARARAGRVMHSRHRALWVPVDGRHEVFALSGPRVARPVDGRSAHSKNALKPPLESQSVRALAQILPSSQVSGDGSRSRAGHHLSHMRSRAAEPRSARSGHKTRLPPSVEAGVAEEPNADTGRAHSFRATMWKTCQCLGSPSVRLAPSLELAPRSSKQGKRRLKTFAVCEFRDFDCGLTARRRESVSGQREREKE